MDTRIALIGIILEDNTCAEKLNAILHEYGKYIVGRMGIPYRDRGINIISIVVDAGKLGMLNGASVKTMYAKNGV